MGLEAVEHGLGHPGGIGVGLQHDRRHGADQHRLGHAALAVAAEIARHLAATGGVSDVDGVVQIKMLGQLGEVIGIVVHVVPSLTWAERPCPRRSWAMTR